MKGSDPKWSHFVFNEKVVLLLVATIANILAPFLQTRSALHYMTSTQWLIAYVLLIRVRIVTSIVVLFVCMVLFQQWPELGSWTRKKISENLIHLSSSLDSGWALLKTTFISCWHITSLSRRGGPLFQAVHSFRFVSRRRLPMFLRWSLKWYFVISTPITKQMVLICRNKRWKAIE